MSRKSDVVLIADFGRSGQGWLSYMLCHLLNARFIEPYCLLRGVVYSTKPQIVDATRGRLPGRAETGYSLIVKTHNFPDPYFSLTDKVILLARDPRDVAVSAYARYRVKWETGTDLTKEDREASLLTDQPACGGGRTFRDWVWSRKRFCMALTAYKWTRFYSAWDHMAFAHRVTYEALSREPHSTLRGILRYLDIDVSEPLLNEAIRRFSFEALSGRRRGEEAKDNTSFRKGVVGDHKAQLNEMDQMAFRRICGTIAKRWGYLNHD